MTETTREGVYNIAHAIRTYTGPTGERFDLAAQAKRLRASLEVVEKWMGAARDSAEPGELTYRAEYIRDTIEEEFARVYFEIEVLERRRIYEQAWQERGPADFPVPTEAEVRAAVLSDSLGDAYGIVSGSSEGSGYRYKVMGALLAARDAVDDEVEAPQEQ